MRRNFVILVLCLAAGVVTACTPEMVVETPAIPTAGVRFINAVPDMDMVDFRFVDIVESNAHWNQEFRNNPSVSGGVTASADVQYKAARAGERHFRIFMSGSSTLLKDTVVTLEAGTNYTVILWGYSNPSGPDRPAGAQAMRVDVIDESVDVPDNQVALRVINASSEAIDASYYPDGDDAPGSVLALNVAPMTFSNHVNTTPGEIRYNLRPAGNPSLAFVDGLALLGTAAITGPPGPIDARPGTTVGGSAVTAIFFDEPVPGTPTEDLATSTGFQISTGSTINLHATATGYSRSSGSFITNGFFLGQEITVSGFTNPENNGTSVITRLRDAPGTDETELSATATGYARADGSFLDDGFEVDDVVFASGFDEDANNGRSVVTNVTDTDLTVTKAGGTVVEAADDDREIAGNATITVSKTGGTVVEAGTTGETALGATTVGYTRTTGSFVDDGFAVGQSVNAEGFDEAANNGASVVTAVTDLLLTVTKDGGTVLEAEAADREISNADSRSVRAPRRWSLIWDRRPPRPPGV